MTEQDILSHCDACIETDGVLVFTDEQFRELTPELVEAVRTRYGSNRLMQLPQHEVTFFEWLKEADFTSLKRVNASYVSEKEHQRHDDMVWRLKVGQQWVWVYLLLEFQSEPDPWQSGGSATAIAFRPRAHPQCGVWEYVVPWGEVVTSGLAWLSGGECHAVASN